MTLNIKNADAERWAREIADITGQTVADVVASALREKLARIRPATAEDLRAIGHDSAARWPDDQRTSDHGHLLYDDLGLPK